MSSPGLPPLLKHTLPVLSEKRNSFSELLKNKGLKEEKKAKVGLDAIDTSTTLESNKSLP